MKQFFRTIAGKTILFLLCLLSVCVLIASIGGAGYMVSDGRVYYQSEEETLYDTRENLLIGRGYVMLHDMVSGTLGSGDDGQVVYTIRDDEKKVLYQSPEQETTGDEYTLYYGVKRGTNGIIEWIRFYSDNEVETIITTGERIYSVHMAIPENSSVWNDVGWNEMIIHAAYLLRFWIYVIGFLAAAISIISFIMLMCVSGRRRGTEELVPGLFNGWPIDLLAGLWIFIGIMSLYFIDWFSYVSEIQVVVALLVFVLAISAILGLSMSVAVRLKQHTLIRNTVVFRVLKFCWKTVVFCWRLVEKILTGIHRYVKTVVQGIPLVRGVLIVSLGITFAEWLLLMIWSVESDAIVLFFLEKVLLIPFLVYIAILLKRLMQGGEALAAGDLAHVTETTGLWGDFRKHAENLNSIAGGMAIAVEDRLKSERMKTELITNVSHDIKTPLTSIINYADLISKEPCENEKIAEYTEVLTRQSSRLKRLIEDLVEASKASTGNLEVKLMLCDASVFVEQADGEYEEKLQKANLKLVTKLPEQELKILADGRRMWRIFDNLLNNVCKYAQEGTRVYLSLEQVGAEAVFTLKNTSRDALDMTEEELMERFTRGDSSRNTEGNGLGLSIARSLAELQGGNLKLEIDGDLFKAILKFPVA